MANFTMDQLCGWASQSGPWVDTVGGQLTHTRDQLQNAIAKRNRLESEKARLEAEAASLESQLTSLYNSYNNSDDDDDDSEDVSSQIASLESQLASVEGRLRQVEDVLSDVLELIQILRDKCNTLCSKLQEMDTRLQGVYEELRVKLGGFMDAKEKFSRDMRFGDSTAAAAVQKMQAGINRSMNAQKQVEDARKKIAQLLGGDHGQQERILSKGYSR